MANELTIYSGTPAYDRYIKVLSSRDVDLREMANVYGPYQVLFQRVPVRKILAADNVIFDLNPRIPHVWILMLIRKALRRPTTLWGHAFPRRGPSSASDAIRGLMRSMSDGLVTYTRSQAAELAELHPVKDIYTAPNALYFRNEIGFSENTTRTDIIYVGRLESSKKVLDLLMAFELIAHHLPDYCRLVIVGEGNLRSTLDKMVSDSPLGRRIKLMGHIDIYESLKELYGRAFVSVSPGYVGLSITQSFAFGVPMIISRHEPHSPEIEAAVENRNCVYFESDDVNALAQKILSVWQDRRLWCSRGAEIAHFCADEYSVEAMGEGIIRALKRGNDS